MRIWIDGQCLQTSSRDRGIGRYLLGLLSGLAEQEGLQLQISFNAALEDTLISSRELVSRWIAPNCIHVWHGMAEAGEASRGYTARRRGSEIALSHHVSCLAPDVALVPSLFEGFDDVATPFINAAAKGIDCACIVYDFIPRHFPDRFLSSPNRRAAYDRRVEALKGFKAALAISDFTKQDLASFGYRGRASSIAAGIDEKIFALSVGLRDNVPPQNKRRYLLYVGSLDWHKNVQLIADAFILLPRELRSGLCLKIVGSEHQPHQEQLRRYCASLGISDTFLEFEGHVSDQKLVQLYRGALALVHPSLMEGFGLTVLEAMQLGTPVVSSTAGALVEVVGSAGLSFSPQSASDLEEALRNLMTIPDLARRLREDGRSRAAEFNWARSAQRLVTALTDTAQPASTRIYPSRDALRTSALESLEPLGLPSRDIVAMMALSEPSIPEQRKLIIDATSTLKSSIRTGIQRVVKSICTEARTLADSKALLAKLHVGYADDASGWYEVGIGSDFYSSKVEKADGLRLQIANGDVLLLLDSSWEFYQAHGLLAKRARLRGATVVSCLYDLVPLASYAFCDTGMSAAFSKWFAASVCYSDAYVCISKTVADELFDVLSAINFPRKIDIGYWHLGANFAPVGDVENYSPKFNKGGYRFLMVGTIEPRKGYDIALSACSALWEAGSDFELVVVGKSGWNNKDFIGRLRRHPEFNRRLRWLPQVDDVELQSLYASCDALIAASYSEGFGLPIVEAQEFGKPVIASDIPVFREVATNCSAFFFPVGSVGGLSEAVADFMRRPQTETQVQNFRRLSWQDSAKELTQMILEGRWYKTYRPNRASSRPLASAFDLVRMTSSIEPKERQFGLELVSGPSPINNGTFLRYIVKVTNKSNIAWSSLGDADDRFAVKLSYVPVTIKGTPTIPPPLCTTIPFVLNPGQTHYMPIEVSAAAFDATIGFVDIQLIQQGVARWGPPLRVAIHPSKHSFKAAEDVDCATAAD